VRMRWTNHSLSTRRCWCDELYLLVQYYGSGQCEQSMSAASNEDYCIDLPGPAYR
jgi:hypothetical protein